jgi:hypothetical protein
MPRANRDFWIGSIGKYSLRWNMGNSSSDINLTSNQSQFVDTKQFNEIWSAYSKNEGYIAFPSLRQFVKQFYSDFNVEKKHGGTEIIQMLEMIRRDYQPDFKQFEKNDLIAKVEFIRLVQLLYMETAKVPLSTSLKHVAQTLSYEQLILSNPSKFRVAIYDDLGVSYSCVEGFERCVSNKACFLPLKINGEDLRNGIVTISSSSFDSLCSSPSPLLSLST